MGSKVSIDKHVSNLEDILEMSPAYFSSKLKFENKIPETITQHIKIWRYYEEDKKSKIVKSAPMSLQAIQTSNFTFVSNECYLVLFVYKKGTEENSALNNFPQSMWSVVESYSNLTPRGLEVPVASSESLTNLNKEVLESFLLPRRPIKKEEGKFEYMIFVWNGKTASPLIKSVALSAAFEFDSFINKAKEPLLHVLFSGGVIRNKKLQKGTILQMNSALPKDLNKELDSKFDNLKDTIYLLKFLFPNPEHKHQALLFNERFLKGNDNGYQDGQFISIGENIEVENEDDQHLEELHSRDYQEEYSQDIEPASISDRKNQNNHLPPKMTLPLPVRQPHEDVESSDINRGGKKVPGIPSLSLNPRGNPMPQPEPDRNFEPASHSSDDRDQERSESFDNSQNAPPESDDRDYNMEDGSNIRNNKGMFVIDIAGKAEKNQPKTYEEFLAMKDKSSVSESLQKQLKIDHFSGICSEVIEDFLYVSGEKIAKNLQILEDVGITHIVNAAADVCSDFFADRFNYLHYYLKDAKFEMIEAIFYDVISFMEEAKKSKGKILVHCAQGVSRSVTLCIAYLIFSQNKTYAQAEEHLKKARGVANPNIGFIAQLMNFDKRLHHPFSALNSPRIFCVGSHQRETPQTLVVRMINETFYDQKCKKKLDPRSVFIIQTENQI